MAGKKSTLLLGDDLLNPQDLRVDFLQSIDSRCLAEQVPAPPFARTSFAGMTGLGRARVPQMTPLPGIG